MPSHAGVAPGPGGGHKRPPWYRSGFKDGRDMSETAGSGARGGAIRDFAESAIFRNLITSLIVVNAIILGWLTYLRQGSELHGALNAIDHAITWIFVVEILLKLAVYRFGFFRSGWNWFDFIVVGVSLIPGAEAFSALRALRVLRVLRLLHIVPMMKQITEALFKALPGMGAILAVLALVTYVASVMATMMYGASTNEEVQALFGDLQSSAFTLFQVMTMDGWRNEVVQKVIDDGHPYAWVFFLTFIFLASFAVLNLFIALIVEALQAGQEAAQEAQIEALEEEAEEAHEEREEMMRLMREMHAELKDMRRAMGKPDT
jgi:voltage-gated sodium channel